MFHANPHCFKIVDHIDGNGKNNHFSNLRWVSSNESNLNRVVVAGKYLHGIFKRVIELEFLWIMTTIEINKE
jgi:HNH endonuclease